MLLEFILLYVFSIAFFLHFHPKFVVSSHPDDFFHDFSGGNHPKLAGSSHPDELFLDFPGGNHPKRDETARNG